MKQTTLTRSSRYTNKRRSIGYIPPSTPVQVFSHEPRIVITESEILHWLLVEALKDEFQDA